MFRSARSLPGCWAWTGCCCSCRGSCTRPRWCWVCSCSRFCSAARPSCSASGRPPTTEAGSPRRTSCCRTGPPCSLASMCLRPTTRVAAASRSRRRCTRCRAFSSCSGSCASMSRCPTSTSCCWRCSWVARSPASLAASSSPWTTSGRSCSGYHLVSRSCRRATSTSSWLSCCWPWFALFSTSRGRRTARGWKSTR
uniref:Uncharacterized protein n=1 Tax=Ixodes ricinus TaxID=34613 RepID=A0A147BE08_IXORI